MKILFLDIDGVLNSWSYDSERALNNTVNIDDSRMPLLREIIDKTGAEIILSSSWRHKLNQDGSAADGDGARIVAAFARYGMRIIGQTPSIAPQKRAEEIGRWLAEHKGEVESYTILDDAFGGWGEHSERLVKTNYRIGRGLEQRHVDAAVEILNNRPIEK